MFIRKTIDPGIENLWKKLPTFFGQDTLSRRYEVSRSIKNLLLYWKMNNNHTEKYLRITILSNAKTNIKEQTYYMSRLSNADVFQLVDQIGDRRFQFCYATLQYNGYEIALWNTGSVNPLSVLPDRFFIFFKKEENQKFNQNFNNKENHFFQFDQGKYFGTLGFPVTKETFPQSKDNPQGYFILSARQLLEQKVIGFPIKDMENTWLFLGDIRIPE